MIARVPVAAALSLVLSGVCATPAAADSVRDREWHLATLDIARAHRITKGAGVTVAVIDTGVSATHRDLAGAVLPGADAYPNGTGDGREDLDGHGTEMAGLIAGRGHGRGGGVLGIAPAAKILPIEAPIGVLATDDSIVAAIEFAVGHGADVINMSFRAANEDTLHDAIRAASAADVVLVAAVGNISDGAAAGYPGRFAEVLTVGAVDRRGSVADFSVRGPQVEIVAPGAEVVTTGVGASGYCLCSGTSEATAVVSGAAALVRARHPDLSAAEVVHRLTATAVDAGPKGRDDAYGYGRLDVVRALTANVPPVPASASPSPEAAPPAGPPPPSRSKWAPLLVAGAAALAVLLLGALAVGAMIRRRRPGDLV
ncbi:type VII secretion-associated serine protease mycosin [Amorphoplanes digitatis]|uniref:Type VII secretion-associated serine protease mycosin n=1 Tax=Actinoplanes digitatis TaxID=1868 RepID=A0A7W7HY29_9ACTN|nr:type VII secretion-associated serine protease mycosin [Actinoplanes digitatis]MBB4762880.1 type VII secretion-associated serine protease mycosin [Actinoplanes digitatis]GID91625.1 type VII secretion-associated serine protease [Actinoplanes digitatis]